jgi:hypothetical protein
MEPFSVPVIIEGEYDSSPNPLRENSYIEGWNVLLRGTDGVPESWNGIGPVVVSLGADGAAVLELVGSADGNTFYKAEAGGASSWLNNSLFYVGAGNAYYGSGSPLAQPATSELRVRLSSGAIYLVGLNTPAGATTLGDDTALSTAGFNGTRAFCFTEYNPDTGWESNRSAPSNVFTFTNRRKARVQIPAAATNAGRGATRIYRYWTPAGLGGLGQVAPFYRLGSHIAYPPAGLFVEDFNDTNLNANIKAPVSNDPPPAGGGLFVVAFDAIIVLVGTYGGFGISPSDPNSSGVFDPLNTIFPYAVERIRAVWPRAGAGYAVVATDSSLFAIYPVGGRPGVGIRPLWPNNGVPAGHKGGKFFKDIFFCYTTSGPAMLVPGNLEPQIAMNLPVRDEMRRNFDPSTVTVGVDPKDELVLFAGRMTSGPLNGQWVAFPYRVGVGWGPKLVLGGQPRDAITFNYNGLGDKCYFLIGGGLRAWDTAGGSGLVQGWLLRTGAMSLDRREKWKSVDRIATTANGAATCKLYTDLDTSTPTVTYQATAGHGRPRKVKLRRAKSIQLEFSGNTSGRIIYQTVMEGAVDPRFV